MELRRRPSRPCRQASQTSPLRWRGAGPGWLVFVPAGAHGRRRSTHVLGETSVADKSNGKNTGKIVEIKGVVLDAFFADKLPEINHALSIQVPIEGGTQELIAEVQQHRGDDRVRAVAMDSTD